MAAPLTTYRFTVDEYHRMAQAGILTEDDRVELLDGQIVVMSPIGSRHAATVGRLTHLFSHGAGDRAIVWVQNPIVVGRHWEPQPDVCLLAPRDDFYDAAHPAGADVLLVVEVADTSPQEDRTRKIPVYAGADIPEAWLVALPADRIEVYRKPAGGKYTEGSSLSRGDAVRLVALPDVELVVDEILG